MIEWKMLTNGEKLGSRVIGKLGNDVRLFKEKRTNLKYKRGNRFCTIHGEGDYKRKSNPNPHTNFVF